MAQVVVLDVETTGFGEYDRIIEVAGIIFDTDFGEVVGEFETLVNPERSISPEATVKAHQLQAHDLSAAPVFSEVGPWLARLLHRRPMIAYNSDFDQRMLNQEFIRTDLDFRVTQVACAMNPFSDKPRLEIACERIGYSLENGHSALADARAALAVSSSHGWELLLQKAGRNEHLADGVTIGAHRTLSRFQAGLSGSFELTRFNRGEEFRDQTPEESYLFLLDEVLEDKEISAAEKYALDVAAKDLGISDGLRVDLHRQYLADIENAVSRDGVITSREMQLVNEFASLLGVETTLKVSPEGDVTLSPGALISATSEAVIDGGILGKDALAEIVQSRGFTFSKAFRKSDGVDLLLIPTTGHISGKTRQARAWGIPQMSVAKFLDITT